VDLVLRELTPADEAAFFEALSAWDDPSFPFALDFKPGMSFQDYLVHLAKVRDGRDLPAHYVPGTMLYGFLGQKIVGRLSLRHRLNEFLLRAGGHIGYGVLPEYRRRGLATEMLKLSLPLARSLGIERCLLICDDDNIASRKTIERCGGVLENVTIESDTEKLIRRYWIELK